MMRRSRLFIGLKWNGMLRFLHPLGRGQRAHAQFLDAQHAIVVGVEAQPRVFLGRHPQRFHGQLLQRQQQFGFVRQQQIHVGAGEAHQQIRILKIRMQRFALADFVVQVKPANPNNLWRNCSMRGPASASVYFLSGTVNSCSSSWARLHIHHSGAGAASIQYPLLHDTHQVTSQLV